MKCIGKRTALALIYSLCAMSIFARDVYVTVEDTELGLPLEGAVIRSWDGSQYTCDEDGRALIPVPDDRQVVIQAAYPGYENARLVITVGVDEYTLTLLLVGIMENTELIVEAERPGTNETRTGRSIAVTEQEIAQTAEIGIFEDVINSIKLLPGVGYAGIADAQPSIRGGDPNDLRASLDGFYVFYPYHLGGAFSMFDPGMIENAQLSHGVFSSRHGHSTSGLLDITTITPSSTETKFELGVNTSAVNAGLSIPLAGKGGILFMGRVTYYDPFIRLYQSIPAMMSVMPSIIADLRVVPYIRSGTVTGNYRFADDLELKVSGFFGMDGIGTLSENSSSENGYNSNDRTQIDMVNYQGFITSGLSWNPRNDMLLKFTAGTGYQFLEANMDTQDTIQGKTFEQTLANTWYYNALSNRFENSYSFNSATVAQHTNDVFNVQGRIDYDWALGNGFLLAAGVQEMFNRIDYKAGQYGNIEKKFSDIAPHDQDTILGLLNIDPTSPDRTFFEESVIVSFPFSYNSNTQNNMFVTSGYTLVEYTTPNNRFGAELGLRLDHYYLSNSGFDVSSKPVLNPRLNLDFNVFKNKGFVQSFDLTTGTGLFSSTNNSVIAVETIDEYKPDRAWTSIVGTRLEFEGGVNVNIEGYHKYLFDRMYIPVNIGLNNIDIHPQFDGIGRVWGFDLLLQKKQSRYWDGWISYSYNWTKHHDPASDDDSDDWYFPSYHRFHNLNFVLNVKPVQRINIYTRIGLASGVLLSELSGDGPVSYPVYLYDPDNPANSQFIEKYFWLSEQDGKRRASPSLQMDVKFSIFGKSKTGKSDYELYVAIENILALLYTPEGNPVFNPYTGDVDTGFMASSLGIAFPIPSFGFKVTY